MFQIIASLLLVTSLINAENGPPKEAIHATKPYLISETHPIKTQLDAFFHRERFTFCEKSLKEAGFTHYRPRDFTRLIVAKHPRFPGYVFKMYLDVQQYYKSKPEWKQWVLRVRGAKLIGREIEKQGWQHLFKVPQKWIYRLPPVPKPEKGYLPKYYILVEEDMDLLSDANNKAVWKSDKITPELLTKLHHLIDELGLLDCAKIDNVPFSHDGRIAFIDTQTFHAHSIAWESLNDYLNSKNRKCWVELTEQD